MMSIILTRYYIQSALLLPYNSHTQYQQQMGRQLARRILLCLLLFSLFSLSLCKRVYKSLPVSTWSPQSHTVFITKFMVGEGQCQFQLAHTKTITHHPFHFYDKITIGAVSEHKIKQFLSQPDCQSRYRLYDRHQKIKMGTQGYQLKHMRIMQIKEPTLYYFYLFACDLPTDSPLPSDEIGFTLITQNNRSHFGQDEKEITGYVILVIIWLIILYKFSKPIMQIFQEKNPQLNRVCIFLGAGILGIAYIYKLLHLAMYYTDGKGLILFQEFYTILKHFGQAVISTTLLAIACGWSLTYSKVQTSTIIVGTVNTLINIICLTITSSFLDQRQDTFHIYDHTLGKLVLILRVLMAFAFVIAIVKTSNQMGAGRPRNYLFKFGCIGLIYFLCWPITVIIVQAAIPSYMQKTVITFVEQLVHLVATTYLCYIITFPDSQYRSVSILANDNPFKMKDYKHK